MTPRSARRNRSGGARRRVVQAASAPSLSEELLTSFQTRRGVGGNARAAFASEVNARTFTNKYNGGWGKEKGPKNSRAGVITKILFQFGQVPNRTYCCRDIRKTFDDWRKLWGNRAPLLHERFGAVVVASNLQVKELGAQA